MEYSRGSEEAAKMRAEALAVIHECEKHAERFQCLDGGGELYKQLFLVEVKDLTTRIRRVLLYYRTLKGVPPQDETKESLKYLTEEKKPNAHRQIVDKKDDQVHIEMCEYCQNRQRIIEECKKLPQIDEDLINILSQLEEKLQLSKVSLVDSKRKYEKLVDQTKNDFTENIHQKNHAKKFKKLDLVQNIKNVSSDKEIEELAKIMDRSLRGANYLQNKKKHSKALYALKSDSLRPKILKCKKRLIFDDESILSTSSQTSDIPTTSHDLRGSNSVLADKDVEVVMEHKPKVEENVETPKNPCRMQ